jgi:murein tripeptide amidase MpaA
MLGKVYMVVEIEAPLVKNENDEWDFSIGAWENANELRVAVESWGASMPNINAKVTGYQSIGYTLGKD